MYLLFCEQTTPNIIYTKVNNTTNITLNILIGPYEQDNKIIDIGIANHINTINNIIIIPIVVRIADVKYHHSC